MWMTKFPAMAGIKLAPVVCLLLVVAGCASPQGHLSKADRVVADIISEKQMQGLGRVEPFTVETAEESLRRRLIVEQNLPLSHPGSQGSRALELIARWPGEPSPAESVAGGIPPAQPVKDRLELSLFDALQVAAANSREYQEAKERVFRSALVLDLERNTFRNILFAGGRGR
jgi:hypothetical protein